jgi:hypothetical protein
VRDRHAARAHELGHRVPGRDGRSLAVARVWAAAVVCAAIGVALLWAGNGAPSIWEFPLDDAWIHQVYARGLVTDGMPTYNPGVPEAGFTSPLWLLALAPLQLVGADPVLGAKLLSLLAAILAAVGIARLAVLLGAAPERAWLAPPVVLLAPGFLFAALSGMEVTLCAALLAHGLADALGTHTRRGGLWLGLAAVTRPEAIVVVSLLAVLRWRKALSLAGPAMILVALWASYNLWATGHPLPNTFTVKSTTAGLGHKLRYLWDHILLGGGWPLLIAALLPGIPLLSNLRNPSKRLRFDLISGGVALAVVGPTLAIVAGHSLVPGVLFYGQRYFYPFTVLALAFVVVGLSRLRPALLAGAAVVLASAATPALLRARESYAGHCRDIGDLHTRPALEAGRFTGPTDLIAAEGAGASRYLSGRPVLDVVGLNDHRLAHASGDAWACHIVRARPAYVLVPADMARSLSIPLELTPRARYEVTRWSVNGGRTGRLVIGASARVRPEAEAYCAAHR